jgi:Tfp pilus assembly protein PilO
MSLSLSNQVSRIKPLYNYLKKQQENYRFVRTVEISATFVLISFFMFFAIRPTVLTISSLWGDIQSKQLLKKKLETKIDNIVKAQDLFSQVQERYQIVNNSLPDRPQYSSAASQIQQTGNSSGLSINSFDYDLQSTDKDSTTPNVKSYQVNLNINGSFSSATKLISDLLQNRRLINIGAISVGLSVPATSGTPISASPGSISTSFVSSYYYWSPTK